MTLVMETEATTATVASAGKGTGNRPLEGMVALVNVKTDDTARAGTVSFSSHAAAVT